MKHFRSRIALAAAMLVTPAAVFGASHREAPITATDRAADITDFYTFVAYDDPTMVTFIMNVDPFLEPSNGPNYFPFDPNVVYAIHVDNTGSGTAAVSFEFRFTTAINAPSVFTGFVGAGGGLSAPSNAPGGTSGQPVIPPAITSLTGAGAAGFSLMQTYTITMVTGSGASAVRTDMTNGQTLIAVPSNVGPRTMPNYNRLANMGIYYMGVYNNPFAQDHRTRIFAGTVDDPFFINLGSTFDSLNLPANAYQTGLVNSSGIPLPVLSASQDSSMTNTAVDNVAGYNVNTIAIEVPIAMVTVPGQPIIGAWATTSRLQSSVVPVSTTQSPNSPVGYTQVQRMANPLINELIIGTGDKDTWSMSDPSGDSTFANYDLDPLLAHAMNAVFGVTVPDPPRTDLLPLVNYTGPFAIPGNTGGPVADLLRLNTSIPATPAATRSRLGLLGGDPAGWPNGRRVSDDVVDIALRAVAGALCSTCTAAGAPFSASSVAALGDGVNVNDVATQETFPYVAYAHGGTTTNHQVPAPSTVTSPTFCSPNCPQ
jgi:hypothetical protein